mgnify:CR=1 FL=1
MKLTPLYLRTVPERVYKITPPTYPDAELRFAKHARQRCAVCGGLIARGMFWVLSSTAWSCRHCGDQVLAGQAVVR